MCWCPARRLLDQHPMTYSSSTQLPHQRRSAAASGAWPCPAGSAYQSHPPPRTQRRHRSPGTAPSMAVMRPPHRIHAPAISPIIASLRSDGRSFRIGAIIPSTSCDGRHQPDRAGFDAVVSAFPHEPPDDDSTRSRRRVSIARVSARLNGKNDQCLDLCGSITARDPSISDRPSHSQARNHVTLYHFVNLC